MNAKGRIFFMGIIMLLAMFSLPAQGDSITLRDGQVIQGKYIGGTQGTIAFTVGGATQYYDVRNILVMTFDGDNGETQGVAPHPNFTPASPEHGAVVPQHQNTQSKSKKPELKRAHENTIYRQTIVGD